MLWSAWMRRCGWTGIGLLLASAFALAAIGCGGGATTVTTAAKPVEPTAAQIKEKAAAEATAHKEQVARKKEEAREAAEERKHEAREQHKEAAESSGAASSSSGGKTVPSDVVNKNLTDAEDELNSMGISFATNSYGKIVILKVDWGVCSTTPEPGQPVSGTVLLNLGHFSCGA
jgi:hypothetical protein